METLDPIHGADGCSSFFLDSPGEVFGEFPFSPELPYFDLLDFDNQDMKSSSEALYGLEDVGHVGLFTWTENLVSTYASTSGERSGQGFGQSFSEASMVPSLKLTESLESKKGYTIGATQRAESDRSRPIKRKWDEAMTVFPASPNEEMIVRTRKTYSPVRRKQVALNRLLGACIQCRVLKGSVSYHLD
jgi:hypothetical protein